MEFKDIYRPIKKNNFLALFAYCLLFFTSSAFAASPIADFIAGVKQWYETQSAGSNELNYMILRLVLKIGLYMAPFYLVMTIPALINSLGSKIGSTLAQAGKSMGGRAVEPFKYYEEMEKQKRKDMWYDGFRSNFTNLPFLRAMSNPYSAVAKPLAGKAGALWAQAEQHRIAGFPLRAVSRVAGAGGKVTGGIVKFPFKATDKVLSAVPVVKGLYKPLKDHVIIPAGQQVTHKAGEMFTTLADPGERLAMESMPRARLQAAKDYEELTKSPHPLNMARKGREFEMAGRYEPTLKYGIDPWALHYNDIIGEGIASGDTMAMRNFDPQMVAQSERIDLLQHRAESAAAAFRKAGNTQAANGEDNLNEVYSAFGRAINKWGGNQRFKDAYNGQLGSTDAERIANQRQATDDVRAELKKGKYHADTFDGERTSLLGRPVSNSLEYIDTSWKLAMPRLREWEQADYTRKSYDRALQLLGPDVGTDPTYIAAPGTAPNGETVLSHRANQDSTLAFGTNDKMTASVINDVYLGGTDFRVQRGADGRLDLFYEEPPPPGSPPGTPSTMHLVNMQGVAPGTVPPALAGLATPPTAAQLAEAQSIMRSTMYRIESPQSIFALDRMGIQNPGLGVGTPPAVAVGGTPIMASVAPRPTAARAFDQGNGPEYMAAGAEAHADAVQYSGNPHLASIASGYTTSLQQAGAHPLMVGQAIQAMPEHMPGYQPPPGGIGAYAASMASSGDPDMGKAMEGAEATRLSQQDKKTWDAIQAGDVEGVTKAFKKMAKDPDKQHVAGAHLARVLYEDDPKKQSKHAETAIRALNQLEQPEREAILEQAGRGAGIKLVEDAERGDTKQRKALDAYRTFNAATPAAKFKRLPGVKTAAKFGVTIAAGKIAGAVVGTAVGGPVGTVVGFLAGRQLGKLARKAVDASYDFDKPRPSLHAELEQFEGHLDEMQPGGNIESPAMAVEPPSAPTMAAVGVGVGAGIGFGAAAVAPQRASAVTQPAEEIPAAEPETVVAQQTTLQAETVIQQATPQQQVQQPVEPKVIQQQATGPESSGGGGGGDARATPVAEETPQVVSQASEALPPPVLAFQRALGSSEFAWGDGQQLSAQVAAFDNYVREAGAAGIHDMNGLPPELRGQAQETLHELATRFGAQNPQQLMQALQRQGIFR